MGYALGIDLGTTYSAAAVSRDGGTVEVCTLGTTSQSIPSVVVLREDGEILTGEAAERRAPGEPARTAREFKRRLGDPIPLIIGSTPYGAEALMAFLLRDIVAQVAEREGSSPDVIVLTHPANYSDYKRGLLEEAARLAGLDLSHVRFLSEPQAAAIAYASKAKVETGEVVAVYDFGGGTFDAAVVRKDAEQGFTLLGSPEGMERLGGIDIDQAVLAHVDAAVDGMVTSTGTAEPAARAAVVRLREEVRRAKEALSGDTDATIAVALPGLQTEVRITRSELESMIRPRVAETVEALRRAVASSGVTMEQISRVLLVGGSSRIPMVGLQVRELTGRPVAIDAHPKLAIATGAAILGAASLGTDPGAVTSSAPDANGPGKGRLAAAAGAGFAATLGGAALRDGGSTAQAAEAGGAPVSGPIGVPTAQGPAGQVAPALLTTAPVVAHAHAVPKPRRFPVKVVAAAATGVVAAAGVAVIATRGGSSPAAKPAAHSSASATPSGSPAATTPGSAPPITAGGARGATGTATLIAGLPQDNSGNGVPGAATSVSLGSPSYTVVGPDGSIYVLDSAGIRLLRIKDAKVTVAYANSANQHAVGGLAVGPTGTVVLLTIDGLLEITGDGTSKPIASLTDLGEGVTPGTQTPLAYDGAGNLYVGVSNRYKVLRRAVDGTMTLVAGNGAFSNTAGTGDGAAATAAPLSAMTALLVDDKGNLLIGQANGALRRVSKEGALSTIAGIGSTPLAATSGATFAPDGTKASDLGLLAVSALALDSKGRVYVGDSTSSAIVRINLDGTITLVAGDQGRTANPSSTALPANKTRFVNADALAFDKSGALLVTQAGLVLRIDGVAAA